MNARIGAVEAGGTKIVCAVGRSWREVLGAEKHVVATASPGETLGLVLDWMTARHLESPLAAIGVASFGPLDLVEGRVAATTPKLEWRGVSWSDSIHQRLGDIPVALDTDTDGAALAESRWGASRGSATSVYVTVGTGIGGGVIAAGAPLRGRTHPEIGHMFVPRHPSDEFEGTCPSHGDCLEGLASGPAVARRWGQRTADLPSDHPAWALESYYLAAAVANLTAVLSPDVVVLGGGVMVVDGLLSRVREQTRSITNGYFARDELDGRIDDYVVAPGLGTVSGVLGAYALASDLVS